MTTRGPRLTRARIVAAIAPAAQSDYDAMRGQLLAWMRACAADEKRAQRVDARAREVAAVAAELHKLADRIEMGPAWSALEDAFEGEGGPHTSTKDLAWRMRALARAAKGAKPERRTRRWLADAAGAYLQLLHVAGAGKPSRYDADPHVVEFGRLLAEAGHPLSVERVRGLMSKALDAFDPYMPTELARSLFYR